MAGGEKNYDIDALIERALSSDTLMRAPISLHRGVEERLRIAALRDQEARRFQFSMITLLLALLSALFAAGALVWFTNLSLLTQVGVSGGKGQYDHFATSLFRFWTEYQGAYTLILSLLLAAGTLAMAWRPLKKRIRTR